MPTTDSRVSRRNFMKAAGIGAASTALGATTVSSAQASEWTDEFEVIVAGSGGAAFAGAIGALQNGATKVLMLEKAPIVGGTTAKSGGGSWVPNSWLMAEAGQADSREDFLRYCARVSFPELYKANQPSFGMLPNNFKLLEAFYDNASTIFKKLHDSGAYPIEMEIGWEGLPAPDYHGQIAENTGIRGRQTAPLNKEGKRGSGRDMIAAMSGWFAANGGTVLTEHRVVKILKDETGRVIGVQVDSPEGSKSFKASKGVIFGSGGFTHNVEMRSNFLRTPVLGGCAVPTNTGDLILMASEVGVKFGNLNEAWNQQEILEEVLAFSSVPSGLFFLGGNSSIAVNKFGKRMYDEKYVYPERTRSHQVYDQWTGDYPNLYQIFIFDEKARAFGGMGIPNPEAKLPKYVITADTIDELATKIQERFNSLADNIGPYPLDESFLAGLKETIERYNGFAATGKDLDFRRGEAPIDAHFHAVPAGLDRGVPNRYIAPISETGPYYAVLLAAGTLDTKGGPVYNEFGQVLNIHDEPIPGFYVAGNAGASPSGKSYLGGGGTLGLGVAFGYRAGEHAATQPAV